MRVVAVLVVLAGIGCDQGPDGAPPATCGNGALEAGEVCDGSELGGASCASEIGGSGTLGCLSDCSGYDTRDCACEPVTCEDRGAECGEPDNGCGQPLACGGCEGWLSCGVNEPWVCGATCPEGCPAPATCSDEGVCVGATPDDLRFDVRTIEVGGTITLHGATPQEWSGCTGPTDPSANVRFRETTYGYEFTVQSFCGGDFVFGPGALYPGTYDIEVYGDGADETDLPTTPLGVASAVRHRRGPPRLRLRRGHGRRGRHPHARW